MLDFKLGNKTKRKKASDIMTMCETVTSRSESYVERAAQRRGCGISRARVGVADRVDVLIPVIVVPVPAVPLDGPGIG